MPAILKPALLNVTLTALLLDIDGQDAWYSFVGKFNASNLLYGIC